MVPQSSHMQNNNGSKTSFRQEAVLSSFHTQTIAKRPELLLISFFIFSMPIYPPNVRYYSALAPQIGFAENCIKGLLASIIVCCIILIVYAALHLKWQGFNQRALVIFTVLYCVEFIFYSVGSYLDIQPSYLGYFLGITMGACIGPVITRWIRAFRYNFRTLIFYAGTACAISLLLSFMTGLLSPETSMVLFCISALVGSLSVIVIKIPEEDAYIQAHDTESLSLKGTLSTFITFLRITWLPAIGFFVCCYIMNVYTYDAGGIVSSEFTGGLVAAIMAVLASLLYRQKSFVVFVEFILLPIAMAVQMLLGSMPEGTPFFLLGLFTMYAPLFFVIIYALAAMVSALNSGEFPLPLIFGIVFLFVSLVALLGYMNSDIFSGASAEGEILWIIVVMFAAVVFINLSIRAYRHFVASSDQIEQSLTGQTGDPNEDSAAHAALEALLEDNILAMAEQYGLSKRETEVFDYIARGYGSSYIAQIFFISPNTARTHVRNIYRKLGVSSRTEILTLLNGNK